MGVDDRSALIEALSFSYEAEYCRSSSPEWAIQRIAPAIPFIGSHYLAAPRKVLIYASAENLAGDPQHLESLRALPIRQQHQRSHGQKPRKHEDQNVHIEPINNGALLKVARHILSFLPFGTGFSANASKEFLEQVVVANPGKFSIDPASLGHKPRKNLVYANEPEKFAVQQPYLEADFKHLRPRVLILPSTVHDSLYSAGLDHLFQELDHIIQIKQVQFQAIYGRGKRRQPATARSDWNMTAGYSKWRSPWYADAYVQWITEKADRIPWANRVIRL